MMALSGNEVFLTPEATLGPIDPQFGGVPSRAIRRGFERARQALREDPAAIPAYIPLIEKYSLELLELCEDAENLSRTLVTRWLTEYMFAGEEAQDRIEAAVAFFADYDAHLIHSRPITYSKIRELGLKIVQADGELGQLMREAYILLNGFFNISTFTKVFDNSQGLSWGRNYQLPKQQSPSVPQPPQ